MRNGWNSPGRSAVRERALETTGARSGVWVNAALATRRSKTGLLACLVVGQARRPVLLCLVRVIISACRIHRIQRWGSNRCLALEDDVDRRQNAQGDRKSTRLNSSHLVISYAVFCLKKNK